MADIDLPPTSPPDPLPDLETDPSGLVWRVHEEPDPLSPPTYPSGKFRFDAPAGQYSVTYANVDQGACFAEVYGDRQGLIPKDHGGRYLGFIFATSPLSVIPLDESSVLQRLGLDGRIATTTEYAVTQQWSLALHDWFPDADAIRYLGRKATKKLNYCFFLDRCMSDLSYRRLDRLDALETLVGTIAARGGLVYEGFAPGGSWP